MISLNLSPTSLTFKPPLSLFPPTFKPNSTPHSHHKSNQRRVRNGFCKAGFSDDAPIAVAIGACILSSLVFPVTSGPDDDDDDGDTVIDSTDTRLAVMGIISFIPYFNWLSWIFAWLDTGNRRYAVYAIIYLAPYLRSNLSLSPEESWLPIASIVFCIFHIQLEASIKNGDLKGFQFFSQAAKQFSSPTRKKETRMKGRTKEDRTNLPSSQDQSRDEIQGWGVPRKPSQDTEYLNEDEDKASDGARKH